jgi:hypothetical protein
MAANLGWEDRYIMQITGCVPNIVREVNAPFDGEVTLDITGNEVIFRNGNWYRI